MWPFGVNSEGRLLKTVLGSIRGDFALEEHMILEILRFRFGRGTPGAALSDRLFLNGARVAGGALGRMLSPSKVASSERPLGSTLETCQTVTLQAIRIIIRPGHRQVETPNRPRLTWKSMFPEACAFGRCWAVHARDRAARIDKARSWAGWLATMWSMALVAGSEAI